MNEGKLKVRKSKKRKEGGKDYSPAWI